MNQCSRISNTLITNISFRGKYRGANRSFACREVVRSSALSRKDKPQSYVPLSWSGIGRLSEASEARAKSGEAAPSNAESPSCSPSETTPSFNYIENNIKRDSALTGLIFAKHNSISMFIERRFEVRKVYWLGNPSEFTGVGKCVRKLH